MTSQKKGISKILWGIIYLILGIMIFFWVSRHSPHMDLDEMITKINTYYITEPLFTIIILVSALFGVNGIVLIIRGVLAELKSTDSIKDNSNKIDSTTGVDAITSLEKLATLKEKGLLTQAEFDEQKHKILGKS